MSCRRHPFVPAARKVRPLALACHPLWITGKPQAPRGTAASYHRFVATPNPETKIMASLMGQMMHMPLLISSLITHAARHCGDAEIVSKRVEGDIHRTDWKATELRSRKLAQALARLGCVGGDRGRPLGSKGHR